MKNRKRINRFYFSVLQTLNSWYDHIPTNPTARAIYDMLYKPSELSSIDKEARLVSNIGVLNSIINCGHNGHFCKYTTYCPECLSFWRYKVAKSIQVAHQINPKIHVIARQETILMPRGVYQDQYADGEWRLLINRRINPVYELPVGSKWSNYWIWKFIEDRDPRDFVHNQSETLESYWDAFFSTWNAIAGNDIVENVSAYKQYQTWPKNVQELVKQDRREESKQLKNNIKKGISDLNVNPILVELQARWNKLNSIGKNTMGAVHRIIIAPSIWNQSTLLLRLDSLFLDTKDNYFYLQNRYEEFGKQKHFEAIDWPGSKRGLQVWHPRSKVTTVCKSISDNVIESLGFVESRFPCSCSLYPRLLQEEFPFFLNCFADRAMTGMTGFFRNEGV